jgi:hypothetical protein
MTGRLARVSALLAVLLAATFTLYSTTAMDMDDMPVRRPPSWSLPVRRR